MSDESPPHEPANDNGVEEDTLDALKGLYGDIQEDVTRLRSAAQRARGEGDEKTALILSEISGTVLHLMGAFVSLVGESLSVTEERLESLEDEVDTGGPPNRLDAEEGGIYASVLEANIKMIDMASMISSGSQLEELEALKRLNAERLEFTLAITEEEYDEAHDDETGQSPVQLVPPVPPVPSGHA